MDEAKKTNTVSNHPKGKRKVSIHNFLLKRIFYLEGQVFPSLKGLVEPQK